MGSEAHVLLAGGGAEDLAYARQRIASLEALWSRFLPDSEISRLNATGSQRVSVETLELVHLAVEGFEATDGLFDPTILDALIASGYDRTFDDLDPNGPRGTRPIAVPGCDAITFDGDRIVMQPGATFDPGGIGKGYAADLVCEELRARPGVRGACVNLGGDLRVAGAGPDEEPWVIEIEDPFGRAPLGVVALEDGAIATTSRTRRRWRRGGAEHHHVIDPRSGVSADGGLASVTVIAGDAWWAEVVAKAIFVGGAEHAGAITRGAAVESFVVADDGSVVDLTRSAVSR